MNYENKYLESIAKKATRLGRFYIHIKQSAPDLIFFGEVKLLAESEIELSNYERNEDLEIRITKECIKKQIEREQENLIGLNLCSNCNKLMDYNEKLSDEEIMFGDKMLDCARERLEKGITKHCKEFDEYSKEGYEMDKNFSRSHLEAYNELLSLVDKGILKNYWNLISKRKK
jgi:hypothetical protein